MRTPEEKRARYEQLIPHLHNTQAAVWGMVDEGMMRAACGVMATPAKCPHFLPKDDDSIAMMLNYCCFNLFLEGGGTLMDLYVSLHPAEDEDLRAVQEAHQRSYFSLFEIKQLVPRVGAELRDLFTDDIVRVVYPRLAETMRPGLVLPVRAMPLEDFHVIFNGPIPFNTVASVPEYESRLFAAYGKYGVQKGRPLTVEQRANIETFQTIDVLAQRYPELSRNRAKPPAPAPAPAPRFGQSPLPDMKRVGRNDLCPCGSGKKFKQCCLGRN
jgi:hypothetical protein